MPGGPFVNSFHSRNTLLFATLDTTCTTLNAGYLSLGAVAPC
jgi:hypothetical protein